VFHSRQFGEEKGSAGTKPISAIDLDHTNVALIGTLRGSRWHN
jgi:hypothetical protein